MSNLTRYENQARNTHSVEDIDGDHIVDGRRSSGAPVYQLDLSKPTAVIGYFQLTLSMLRWLPLWFIGGWLFVQYVIIPIALTAPVALFTNKPVTLTKTEAGGSLEANTNNITIGLDRYWAVLPKVPKQIRLRLILVMPIKNHLRI